MSVRRWCGRSLSGAALGLSHLREDRGLSFATLLDISPFPLLENDPDGQGSGGIELFMIHPSLLLDCMASWNCAIVS